MKTDQNGRRQRNPWKWMLLAVAAAAAASIVWGLSGSSGVLKAQGNTAPANHTSNIFTPEHTSVAEAVRHFFGMRPTAVQPIAYVHSVHIGKAEMACTDCHVGVRDGPNATIPGVKTCIVCHSDAKGAEGAALDKPAVQQINAYFKRGEEIPWQRVYGWNDESHVHFNHAPHLRAQVSCEKCHGDVSKMATAQKVVDHTMGFCISCHQEKKAPNDCMTCHF